MLTAECYLFSASNRLDFSFDAFYLSFSLEFLDFNTSLMFCCFSSLGGPYSNQKFLASVAGLHQQAHSPKSFGSVSVHRMLILFHLLFLFFLFAVFLATVQATLLLFARLERSRISILHAWSFITPYEDQIVWLF